MHPYKNLPDYQFWKKEPGVGDGKLLDPVGPKPPFLISEDNKIVTAGSCFAQHVAKFLSGSGFLHYISERPHPVIPNHIAMRNNYGKFSARYGNVYTTRQLKQLIYRAFGHFVPVAQAWRSKFDHNAFIDPFRPQIQPNGFVSEAELLSDQQQHLSYVRDAFENMDVFVFTLGLTEAWEDVSDGAIYPIAPGIAGGDYDPGKVVFRNFDVSETYEDLRQSIEFLRTINPSLRIILTVSPVPLNATYENRHVLLSTTWSKSVLRIAAEQATCNFDDCVYFPSYEIITSPHVRGKYFAEDCREVTPEGVKHVMSLFLKHYTASNGALNPVRNMEENRAEKHSTKMQKIVDLLCDEELIDNE
ncbi:GSCFA domain-containing protein [Pseudomaricurvus alcaniphilus]|uniref:GSCFA domain-containing protein n=1 Tax=Pseudomaricurvus alcaniphilus TaxID=1166482 RepID=UPI001409E347|nr:GSCFA domain-containing protein [Pseudomaricurvus alcaniphilus]NHN37604.1 GSCFA domain-containing protein [Pseudomaricurvus alcaniphilus]